MIFSMDAKDRHFRYLSGSTLASVWPKKEPVSDAVCVPQTPMAGQGRENQRSLTNLYGIQTQCVPSNATVPP